MNADPNPAKAIFLEAVERHAPDRWPAFLDRACAGQPDLRGRVEALLEAHREVGTAQHRELAEGAGPSPVATVDEPPVRERPGDVIGSYKLLEQIGEGGFGVVFMAEQQRPVRRKVALKVLKAGMDTRQVVARFEAERQALAIMDHPNIAKVHDGGVTPSGRPYFVMELVKGAPITEFCDQNHLTPRQRLELFVPVCAAVQHAHHKGIIHRDLKPSNILVVMHDTTPVVKVIDFGVAKAVGQELTDKTLFTGFAQMIGTPLYMSPEQAGQSGLDIDTRSDIYSLGVLVYELLTGTTPFAKDRFKGVGYDEMRRIICEEDPPNPSTRLAQSTETLPTISAKRLMEPAQLTRLVRGDLDWIVMKALEKDRNRRYETANGFAMDIQRYLADEPVLACPPSAGYRLRKFARRNKRGLAVAGLVVFFLILLGSGAGWALRDRAARQGRIGARADLILGEVERLEAERKWPEALAVARRAEALTAGGEADAATRERVRQVLHDLEMVARLEELRLFEEYIAGEERGVVVNVGRPHLYAEAFRDFGVDVETLPAEEAAARLRARPAVAVALAVALNIWAGQVRGRDPDQAKRLWALAAAVDPDPWRVGVRRAAAARDVDALLKLAKDPDTARQPPHSQGSLAVALRVRGQPEQALAVLERACEIHPGDFWIHMNLASLNCKVRPARLEEAVRHGIAARALRPRSAGAWNNLGIALSRQKKLAKAVACCQKAIELDPRFATPHLSLGITRVEQGKLDEAVAAHRKAIELDPKNAETWASLGNVLSAQKKLGEAIAAYTKAIDLDPEHAAAHNNLGRTLHYQGKLDGAVACYRKAIAIEPRFALAYRNLGLALQRQGKLGEAIAAYQKAVEFEPGDALAHNNLGSALHKQRKPDGAVACYRKAIGLDPKYALAYRNLGRALHNQGKPGEAIAAYQKAIGLDPKDASAHNNLGWALYLQNKLGEAVAAYRKAIGINPEFALAYHNLGRALHSQGKPGEAVACYQKAIGLDPKDASAHNNLGVALAAQGKLGEAVACYQKAIDLDPKDALAYRNLGNALRRQRKWPEAIAAYRQAVRVRPDFSAGHHSLVGALEQAGKPDEVVAALRDWARARPADASAHYRLGLALHTRGAAPTQLDEAVTAYQKAVELDPRNADAHSNLGALLCDELKDYGKAVECFRKAIKLDPKHATAHCDLGGLLCNHGEYDGAIECFRTALRIDPKFAHAREGLGVALGHKGWDLVNRPDPKARDPRRALETVQEAIELDPRSAVAWQHLGWVRYRIGDWRASIEALEKSCRLENGGDCGQWIVLALAHARLAGAEGLPAKERERRQSRARHWYDQANKEIDRWRARPGDVTGQGIWDFRAEARELRGLKDSKK
jgi:tetratricopeptide (TPR) repeat protein